jgi:hypothetical protein
MKPHVLKLAGGLAIAAGVMMAVSATFGGTVAQAGGLTPTPDPCITPSATPTFQQTGLIVEGNDVAMLAVGDGTAVPTPDCTTPPALRSHTPTPSHTPTITNTPVPSTDTPQPAPATNTPTGGGAGAGITPPNTGSGGDAAGDTPVWALGVAAALVAAGGATVALGYRRSR